MSIDSKSITARSELFKKEILERVTASTTKLTPPDLAKTASLDYGLDRKEIQSLIKDLIESGELTYMYEYGTIFLVKSFNQAVRISKHVVIKPPGHQYQPKPGEVVIQIKPGASFGGGEHPTTRLCVKSIEYILEEIRPKWQKGESSVLDIGTGSGVLVLTAVMLGLNTGLGIDIDPCARAEARANVKLNGLTDRILITDKAIECLDRSFSLVTANLRFPSLKKLYVKLTQLTGSGGMLVLSGVRDHELGELLDRYTAEPFECIWTGEELGWIAVVLKKSKD
jgi:ribosomal protein L11 methyltransferase